MNITLRQLRAFVAVAEAGQFTQAARNLHVTQSALSMLIRELESQTGLRLFDRHTRKVVLSEPGQELLGTARRVLAEVEEAVRHSKELTSHQRGRVSIASGTVLSSSLLIPFIALFQQRYPGIRVELLDMAEQDISRRLAQEPIDFGLGTDWNRPDTIEAHPVMQDQYQALLPHHHPLTAKAQIRWHDLAAHPFIALSSHSPLGQAIQRQLTALDIRFAQVHEVSLHTTVLSMVRHGLGLAILPANTQSLPEAAQIIFRPLKAPVLPRQVSLLQLRQRSLAPAATLFRSELLAHIKRQHSGG